ncbi:polyisoprenoid-binding protein [Propioniciclava sinopodophylli]|jgi:polyisoprenoid-binding protein YceI|uniref:Polyisoprenoid-binding protein n=1 Tax=Propioniciclava sinopodophylli TaxID=1837344 RepID=A0A4Q9KBW4_9ACTN|nr:YceI family protein [Propioniciclava sinopodophylli]TBT83503.1 polyisoprenoid-binding protein [Propioniciclava sinopodophylli]
MSQLTELQGTYVLDPSHTAIGFVTRHAMVTKVRGSFEEYTGTATIDGANPSASTLNVDIKAGSINTRNADRDAHVRSGDFLDVETYPEITFRGTDFAVKGDVVDVTGDLTIRGTTKSVTIPFEFQGAAKDPFGNERIGFEGSADISRADFGLTWNAALETGGFLVADKVTLEFEVSAIKQA